MNPLTTILFALLAGSSLVLWQQASLRQVQVETRRLSQEYAAGHADLQTQEARFADLRSQMKTIRDDWSRAKENAAPPGSTALPTPATEGWWPGDRSYFYLPKSRLKLVNFGAAHVPLAEANAILTRRAKAQSPNITSVAITSPGDSDGNHSVDMALFDGNQLNPDAAALLGMTDDEARSVSDIYARLTDNVRARESARAIRVHDGSPVVARIPDLSAETAPLLEEARTALTAAVGPSRTELLEGMFQDYAKTRLDGMGAKPRDFIRKGNVIIVSTSGAERWQPLSLTGETESAYGVANYTHLFGSGAPCELK
jgi:hypothetical protein